MEQPRARGWMRWLGLAARLGALLVSPSAGATCMELDTYACEIIPTYGDCSSPDTDVWAPNTPFTYRIGCEGAGEPLRSPDLALMPGGALLKARPEPLRQCEQWSLWVLEEPLPAPGPNGTIALRPVGAGKPLQTNLTIVADAAKAPRTHRDPKRDFVCSVAPGIDPPQISAPPAGGCAACAVSLTAPTSPPPEWWSLILTAALAMRLAGRRRLKPRRARRGSASGAPCGDSCRGPRRCDA